MDNNKITPITRIMIIYKTTNLINGKIYIGQDSKNNPKYIGSGVILLKAINKYGKENFKKETIDIAETKKELDKKEIFWINKYSSINQNIGYNLASGGNGCLGCKASIETKLKMSLNNTGINNPMFGKVLSKKTIEERSVKVKKEGTYKGENNGNFKYKIDKHKLIDLYIENDLKIDEIASLFGCHRTVISENLKKYGIKKKPSNIYNLEINDIKNHIINGLNLVKIGHIYGCSNKIIHNFIKKNNGK